MSRAATQQQRETLQALCGGGALPPVPPVDVAASAEPEPIPYDTPTSVQVGAEFIDWADYWAMQEGA